LVSVPRSRVDVGVARARERRRDAGRPPPVRRDHHLVDRSAGRGLFHLHAPAAGGHLL